MLEKTQNEQNEWWGQEEKGGFFGNHYLIGDDNSEGPFDDKPMNLEQRTLREVSYIIDVLQLDSNKHVLDCPCGYGRHLVPLAIKGIKMTGIDLNPQFLEIASAHIKSQKNAKSFLTLREGDMRHLPFRESTFDDVINMYTSFGFFDKEIDNLQVLKEFFRVLKDGGKLLIHSEYNYYRIAERKYRKRRERNLKDGSKFVTFEQYEPEKKRIVGYWKIIPNRNQPVFKRDFSVRLYSPSEFSKMLTKTGFVNIKFLGDLELRFNELTLESHDAVILAEKNRR